MRNLRIVSSDSPTFFAPKPFRRHIQTEVANRVPRQGIDPVCALVWLLLMPAGGVGVIYGIYWLICEAVSLL
jgi:hypothetical protein